MASANNILLRKNSVVYIENTLDVMRGARSEEGVNCA